MIEHVRAVVVLVVLAALAPDAGACPPLELCGAGRTVSTEPAVRSAGAALAEAIRVPTTRRADPGEVEMPWIWQVLRDQVYSRMPTYEKPHEIKLVLAPVVVTSPGDTVPGVGIAGDF